MFDKKFLDAYLDRWCKAVGVSPKQLYTMGFGAWTAFHMESILYPLAEALCPEGSKCGYKTKPCTEECRDDCSKNKEKCGYGTTWSQEYYRVDLGLYRYPNAENGLWAPDYLIEHENEHFKLVKENGEFKIKKKGWFGEFVKLLPINCSDYGARVIISYCGFEDKDENKATYEEYLLHVLNHETVKQTLCEKPILVLLGPSTDAVKQGRACSFYAMQFEKDGAEWKCERGFVKRDDVEREDVKEIFRRMKEELK